MLVTFYHRIKALRTENKRLRHENRELRRRLKQSHQCILMQANKNWDLYQWSLNKEAPPDFRITEIPDWAREDS